MGTEYRHLSEQDRIFLRIMLDKCYPKSKIAKIFELPEQTTIQYLYKLIEQQVVAQN